MRDREGAAAAEELTAERFEQRLHEHRSEEELRKIQRYFKTGPGDYGEGDTFLGVRMGTVFALAKEFTQMAPEELERLLESPVHEARAGALKAMGYQFAHRRTSPARRAELYELHLRRMDRVNNWDLVDLAGHTVVGGYLVDKPRDVLYRLARSAQVWERRLAMYATLAFVRRGEVDDAFAIAEILRDDEHDLIHKVVGGVLRAAGDKRPERLRAFLDGHAARMPRTALRYAMEHLPPEVRAHYRGLAAGPPD